jgi:3-oxoacyl-[acyl-carrier protein] reductase
MRSDGKVLFATGAGSGIAAATARRFASEGGRVAVVDLDGERAEMVAAELDGSLALACDVSDERSVREAVEATSERLGRIDCVLPAAGRLSRGPIEEYSLADWNRMLAVHAAGTFLVCKHALPVLRAAGGGAIVNVSSTGALIARPHLAAYSAAKGAILAFSRQLALDVAIDNVRVNVVAPGLVRTAMTDAVFAQRREDGREAPPGVDSILKRPGEADELAAAICFLLSDDASFLTGSLLVPDGGMTAI